MASGLNALSQTLALRLRDLARMADRLDRLESGSGTWLGNQREAGFDTAAQEMTLRALKIAGDAANFAILNHLAGQATMPVAQLEQASGHDRLSLSERINDLIQVGLVSREIDTDHVQITEGGAALVGLLNQIARETASRLAEYLAPVTTLK
jgi:DNA-binding HxlR family transcriptional regulator